MIFFRVVIIKFKSFHSNETHKHFRNTEESTKNKPQNRPIYLRANFKNSN